MTPQELDALALSTAIAVLTVLLCFPPAVWIASRVARRGRTGRWLLDAVLLLPVALSPAAVGWRVWLAWPASGSPVDRLIGVPQLAPLGLIACTCLLTLPLMIRTLRPAFEAVDHTQVLVARTLGANRWRAWWTVTVAQTSPMMASALALGFAAAWGESGALVVLAAALQGQGASDALAGVATAPMTLISALQTPGGAPVVRHMALACLGVALVAIVISEWAHRRWRRRALPPESRGVAA